MLGYGRRYRKLFNGFSFPHVYGFLLYVFPLVLLTFRLHAFVSAQLEEGGEEGGSEDDDDDEWQEDKDRKLEELASHGHELAWRVAGVFAIVATILSFIQIRLHIMWNTNDILRKYVLRILMMVPIYALESWLGLRFKNSAPYFDTMRECYESLVIYSFYAFLVEFLGGERQMIRILREKPPIKHMFPFCCIRQWRMGQEFSQKVQLGILQFVMLKPLMAFLSFSFEHLDMYWNGHFSWDVAYPYIMFVDNISQTIALYCLIVFYMALKDELMPVNPVPKFMVVKAVVFFTFWQSVALAILVRLGVLRDAGSYTTENVVTSLQDFLVCVEMFAAAISHHYAFSYKEFHDPAHVPGSNVPMFRSLFQAVDVTDVFLDDVDNALFAHHDHSDGPDTSPMMIQERPKPSSPLEALDLDDIGEFGSEFSGEDGLVSPQSPSSTPNSPLISTLQKRSAPIEPIAPSPGDFAASGRSIAITSRNTDV